MAAIKSDYLVQRKINDKKRSSTNRKYIDSIYISMAGLIPAGGKRKMNGGGQCGSMLGGGQCGQMGGQFPPGAGGGMKGGTLIPSGGQFAGPSGGMNGGFTYPAGGRRKSMRGGYALSPLSLAADGNTVYNAGNYSSNVIPTNNNKMMGGCGGYSFGGPAIGGLASASPNNCTAVAGRGGNNILAGGKGKSKKWRMKGCSGGKKRKGSTKRRSAKRMTKRSTKCGGKSKKNKSRRYRMRGGCGPKPLGYSLVEGMMSPA
jgi:hypothetical protein